MSRVSEDVTSTLRSMGHAESHPNGGGQVAVAFQARTAQQRAADRASLIEPVAEEGK